MTASPDSLEGLTRTRASSSASAAGAVARAVAVAVVYTVLARIGLLLDPVGGFATVVWAPTGIAIAAVLLFGYGVTPGIWAGAFAANLLSGAPLLVAAGIASGNTLEAAVAVAVLSRMTRFDARLHRLTDVLLFTLVGAVLAPVVSATIGVWALYGGGVMAPAALPEAWLAWWVGDSIGALLVAPAILVWHARGTRDLAPHAREAAAMLVAVGIVAWLVFFRAPLTGTAFLQAYLVFPPLIWAALRFEQRGAVTAILLTSILAVIGTANGGGPFVEPSLRGSLFGLQTFMGIVALSFLALSATIAEREAASRNARRLLDSVDVANRAKADFLAAMSHELRTPLNAIGGYAQLLTLDVHGDLPPRAREAVERIETNRRHLSALVEDVLSFTRLESGHLTLEMGPVAVRESLEALGAYIGPEAAKKRVELEIHPPAEPLAVRADPERLRQILLNLVVNAIKFSESGSRIELSASRDASQVRIVVTDHGIGIPPDQIPRVFEAFFQVERGHKRRFAGVGLGLTISRDLARAMGGDLCLESAQGHGTTATLTLPLAPTPAQEPLPL